MTYAHICAWDGKVREVPPFYELPARSWRVTRCGLLRPMDGDGTTGEVTCTECLPAKAEPGQIAFGWGR